MSRSAMLSGAMVFWGLWMVGLGCNLTLEPRLDGGSRTFTEAQVAGIMSAAHQAAITAGDIVTAASTDPVIGALAARISYDHRAAWTREQALFSRLDLVAVESATSQQIRQTASADNAVLSGQSSPVLERSYVDRQVLALTHLLNLLDHALVPSAQSESLRVELGAVRDMVAANLEATRSAQQDLEGSSWPPGGAGDDGGSRADSPLPPPGMDGGGQPAEAGVVQPGAARMR